jgi:hypothetical protein
LEIWLKPVWKYWFWEEIPGMLSVEPDAIEEIAISIKKLAQNHFD